MHMVSSSTCIQLCKIYTSGNDVNLKIYAWFKKNLKNCFLFALCPQRATINLRKPDVEAEKDGVTFTE